MAALQVQDLHENCRAVEAQVDALKLQLSQSDALEKRLTEVLHVKDEQVGLRSLPFYGWQHPQDYSCS